MNHHHPTGPRVHRGATPLGRDEAFGVVSSCCCCRYLTSYGGKVLLQVQISHATQYFKPSLLICLNYCLCLSVSDTGFLVEPHANTLPRLTVLVACSCWPVDLLLVHAYVTFRTYTTFTSSAKTCQCFTYHSTVPKI